MSLSMLKPFPSNNGTFIAVTDSIFTSHSLLHIRMFSFSLFNTIIMIIIVTNLISYCFCISFTACAYTHCLIHSLVLL